MKYYYDGKGLGSVPDHRLGKLTKVANDESETLYSEFDDAGRILKSEQITDGLDVCTNGRPACVMTYQYNLAGALTQETYPSGRQVNHNYGADGKLATVSSRVAKNRPFKAYAQAFSYNAAGGVTSMQLGNMRWESTTFNTRLQPTKIALGTTAGDDDMLNLAYTYGTSGASYHDNNGNVLTQTITVENVGANPGFVATQTYTYDELNRLKSATENSTPNGGSSAPSWKQTYLYDRFGNRTFDTSGSNTTTLPPSFNANIYNPTINPANNQFNTGQDYDYDPAGNVVEDATGKKFNYDGENKQTSFGTGGSLTNGGTYFYDGDGHRVKKIVGSEVTVFVYNSSAQMVAEYATTAPSSPQLSHLTSDNLGTPRINTNRAGEIVARHDYQPFGEEITSLGGRTAGIYYIGDSIDHKFTGTLRDGESGLDYFQARYYSNSLGRFTSADPVAGHCGNPQSLNSYAYTWNNPLKFTDPTGMIVEWEDSKKKKNKDEAEARTDAQRKYEDHIRALLNSTDPKKRAEGQKLQAQYERRQKSDVTFHVVKTNPDGASSGELTYGGVKGHLYVNLKGDSEAYGAQTDIQKLAHEFKHGEQFLDSKLGFIQDPRTGKWSGIYDDLVDEAEAFVAGLEAQPLDPSQQRDKFLRAIDVARQSGIDSVVRVLDDHAPYKGRPTAQKEFHPGGMAPNVYAIPKKQP